ncbi:DUF3164 family protein [Aquimarina latercula]|uniref:DUF3164 family protein n=1 Tax=Aquimarina latercula TaxID=987 RepID=UPI0003F7BCDD|nr:DUF3164 family protein [Aquimarina latercula]
MKDVNEIEVHDPTVVPPAVGVLDLGNVSASQLREALEKAETKEKAAQQRKRKAYEEKRHEKVITLIKEAQELQEVLKQFKEKVQLEMDSQATDLAEYGGIRSNSKGGFQIKSKDDLYRIRRTRDTQPTWDERSNKAVELLKDFLHDTVKKRAEKEFNVMMAFLEKNQAGDLEYQKVMTLLSCEDNYNDPRWKEGLRLLKESYQVVLRGFGYYFDQKNSEGKWESILLNFSSI